jgi:hypothetical protein
MPGLVGLFPNIVRLSGSLPSNCISSGITALKRICIAINPDVSYGETATTGFWNGVTPSVGGYVVYIYIAPLGGPPLIFGFSDDTSLINFINKSYSTSYTIIAEALDKIIISNGIFCANYDYPYFPTNGLLLNYDAWYSASYPKLNSNFYDISGNGITASMTNGCSFIDNGIELNGINQIINFGTNLTGFSGSDLTFSIFFSFRTIINNAGLTSKGNAASTGFGLWTNTAGDLHFTHQGIQTTIASGLSIDTRYLLTMRYTNSSSLMEFFMDGTLVVNKSGVNITDASALIMGIYTTTYSNSKIYSVKKHNLLLSSDEIANMYANLTVLYDTVLI